MRSGQHQRPLEGLEDERLLELIARNHPRALDELAERYLQALRSHALSILGNDAAAEAVALEVLELLWVHRQDGLERHSMSVRAFLLRKARWLALNELRRRKLAAEREWLYATSALPRPERPDAVASRAELSRSLLSAIGRLPRRQQQAFLLRHLDDLSYKHIAAAMRISVRTARHYVELARLKLRASLAREAREWLGCGAVPRSHPRAADSPTASRTYGA